MVFWTSIADSRDVEDFRLYLTQFPKGVYAGLAAKRMRQLTVATSSDQVATNRTPSPNALIPLAETELSSRLHSAFPDAKKGAVDLPIKSFLSSPEHRAIFKSPDRMRTYRLSNFASAEHAAELGFEKCQMFYGAPCELLALDSGFQAAPGERRPAPRAQYAGAFDVAQIPGVSDERRNAPDLADYARAKGPKAIAIHHWGKIFTAIDAADSFAAQQKALDDCDDDPVRKGRDGPCYLYAVGDQVVLPQHRFDPLNADKSYARIRTALARVAAAKSLDRTMKDYVSATEPKALAVQIETGRTFFSYGGYDESRQVAETLALEGCQQTYGSPCVTVAVGTELRAADPAAAAKRDMPRLHYAGAFEPAQAPFVTPLNAGELNDYASLPAPKAVAIRAVHTHFSVISGAKSKAEAERRALADCKDSDPKTTYPCFLYASDDLVVLPERRTEPSR